MAATLIDINRACTCKVRVLNPFPTAMSIKQDAVIGRAEPIEGNPVIVTNEEDSSETENHAAIRRIKLVQSENTQPIPTYTGRKVQVEDNEEVPSHPTELYEKTTQGLNGEQKQRVAQLLNRFKDSFSRDEWDLSITHLTAHAIKTEGLLQLSNHPDEFQWHMLKRKRKQ